MQRKKPGQIERVYTKALTVDTKVDVTLDLEETSLALRTHGSRAAKLSQKKLRSLSKTLGSLRETWRNVPASGQSVISTEKMNRKDRSFLTTRRPPSATCSPWRGQTRDLKGDYLRLSRANTQSVQQSSHSCPK